MTPISSKPILKLLNPEKLDDSISVLTDDDIKYQDFEYTLINRDRVVFLEDHKKIDFTLALKELNDLDWTLFKNGISIYNNKLNENIFCHRVNENAWWVLTPIKLDGVWTGHEWAASTDTETLIGVLELFFEEMPWFKGLIWKKINWNCNIMEYWAL
jgi:hypothetical protein